MKFDLIIFFIIIALIFSAVFPAALYFILPCIFALVFISERSLQINEITRTYFFLCVIVFLYVILHSFLSKSVEFIYFKGFLRYLSYFSFALLVSNLNNNNIQIIFKICIVFLIVTLPWSIYQINITGRYNNIFSHANHLGYVLMILSYFVLKHKPFSKIIRIVVLCLLVLSLILTFSTGAMLTFSSLTIYYYFNKIKQFVTKITVFLLLVSCVFLFVLSSSKIGSQIESLQYFDFSFILQKAQEQQTSAHFTISSDYGSFIWRSVYWVNILISFFDNNIFILFFGEGIDTLTKGNYIYNFMYTDPHNDYLKVLVEFGIFGFFLLFLFFKRLYNIISTYDILIIFMIPFFFANIIISWPFNIIIIMYLFYELNLNKRLKKHKRENKYII